MRRSVIVGMGVGILAFSATGVARAQVPILDEPPTPSPSAPAPAAPPPAATPAPAAPRPAAAPAGGDTVFMRDGSVMRGTVVRQAPGQFVIIRTPQGEQTISWDSVSRVVVSAGSPLSGVAPGVSTSESHANVGPGGVGVGMSGEHVVKLNKPGNSFWQIAIDGGFQFGTSLKSGEDFKFYGGGADFTFQYRVGGQFPDENGGSWSGFGLDLGGGVFGGAVVSKVPDPYGGTTSQGEGSLMETVGGSAGYQFFHFGKMDDDDLKQHGFGFFLGGKVGFANTTVFPGGGAPSQSQGNAQYGPQIQLTFPEYNFGSTKRAAFYISAFVLPTGDFLFANIQAGGSFN